MTFDYSRQWFNGRVRLEHVMLADYMRSGLLTKHPEYVVHHIDGNKANNSPSNLLVFGSKKAHEQEHAKLRAIEACGNQDWRPCRYCCEYDSIDNLECHEPSTSYWHKECGRKSLKNYRRLRRIRQLLSNS